MTMELKHLDMAVIGDEDLVNGLRLAGVRHYRVTQDDSPDEIRQALAEFVEEPDIGIIVILEDYAKHVEDLITQAQERKGSPSVVVEVPSKRGTRYEDVAKYYKSYIRKFIGFDIEI